MQKIGSQDAMTNISNSKDKKETATQAKIEVEEPLAVSLDGGVVSCLQG